jgi:hypothetical protein
MNARMKTMKFRGQTALLSTALLLFAAAAWAVEPGDASRKNSASTRAVEMPGRGNYTADRLADRAQIQDTIFRYCRGIDRQDYEAVRATYHPDATDWHGPYKGGIDGLIEWMKERHKSVPFSMHSVTNMLIEFSGPDLAVVETYFTLSQFYPAESKATLAQLSGGKEGKPGAAYHLVMFGRYVDRFERRSGVWRVSKRVGTYDSSMMLEQMPGASVAGEGWSVGLRSKEDPLYKARLDAGIRD